MDDKVQKAKIGDFVVIIGNSNEHGFEIGQVVQVVDWYDFDPDDEEEGVECAPIGGGEHWFISHTDYRITAPVTEYERLRKQLDELDKTIATLQRTVESVGNWNRQLMEQMEFWREEAATHVQYAKLVDDQNAIMREALEWYANLDNYGEIRFQPPIPDVPIMRDGGQRAREALVKIRGEYIREIGRVSEELGLYEDEGGDA